MWLRSVSVTGGKRWIGPWDYRGDCNIDSRIADRFRHVVSYTSIETTRTTHEEAVYPATGTQYRYWAECALYYGGKADRGL
mmetsp:Transcript_103956/g.155686  ORF Transcript_103956/g.155686 Transcript_103956/m.155686 type:complete len:81 (-) Transcript_103956:86-328(-)